MPHLDVEATIAGILRLRARYPQAIVLIEEAANGFALVAQTEESARDRQRGRGEAVGRQNVEVPGDVPGMAAHDWFVPRDLPWVEPFLAQLMSFPAAKNDDMADACSQAASWLLQANQHHGAIYNAFTGQEIPGCYR
jgi:phage terminase large subunit-like protein